MIEDGADILYVFHHLLSQANMLFLEITLFIDV